MSFFPRVSLYHTEERNLLSNQTGIDYRLAIYLPESYGSTDQHYPVIYLLDADIAFGMAANFMQFLVWGDKIPEHIVFGIGYDMQSIDEWARLRELDFKIPEVQANPPDSHADRFLAVVKEEIIPFVEGNYRVKAGERTLYGFSSSGFFTLYALCNEPGLFRRYLAGSPDTDLSFPYLTAHDQQLLSRKNAAPIDLCITVGGKENGASQSSVVTFQGLVAAIQSRAYPGLRLITEIYPGEGHSVVGAAMTLINGLRKCFHEE